MFVESVILGSTWIVGVENAGGVFFFFLSRGFNSKMYNAVGLLLCRLLELL